jgi:TonB family protein
LDGEWSRRIAGDFDFCSSGLKGFFDMGGFRGVPCLLALVMASFVCAASPLVAQQAKADQPTGLQSAGQQAISVVLKHSVLDPTTLVQKTGKPLAANGTWSVGKEAPASCPQTTDTCVRIFYRVPDADVSCEWDVRLIGDGSDGTILTQNEDAARYLLRKLSTSQAAELILTRKQPTYPPIAAAAHVHGEVAVRMLVSGEGTPEKVVLVSGPEMLRASAIAAAKGWTFKPLMAGTQAARFETDVIFQFTTSGSASGVTSKP